MNVSYSWKFVVTFKNCSIENCIVRWEMKTYRLCWLHLVCRLPSFLSLKFFPFPFAFTWHSLTLFGPQTNDTISTTTKILQPNLVQFNSIPSNQTWKSWSISMMAQLHKSLAKLFWHSSRLKIDLWFNLKEAAYRLYLSLRIVSFLFVTAMKICDFKLEPKKKFQPFRKYQNWKIFLG